MPRKARIDAPGALQKESDSIVWFELDRIDRSPLRLRPGKQDWMDGRIIDFPDES
jgi:hypothetical protein